LGKKKKPPSRRLVGKNRGERTSKNSWGHSAKGVRDESSQWDKGCKKVRSREPKKKNPNQGHKSEHKEKKRESKQEMNGKLKNTHVKRETDLNFDRNKLGQKESRITTEVDSGKTQGSKSSNESLAGPGMEKTKTPKKQETSS